MRNRIAIATNCINPHMGKTIPSGSVSYPNLEKVSIPIWVRQYIIMIGWQMPPERISINPHMGKTIHEIREGWRCGTLLRINPHMGKTIQFIEGGAYEYHELGINPHMGKTIL